MKMKAVLQVCTIEPVCLAKCADWSEDDSDDNDSFLTGASNSVSPSSSAHSPVGPEAFNSNEGLPKPAGPDPLSHTQAAVLPEPSKPSVEERASLFMGQQEGSTLLLGSNGEFRLSSRVATRLYSHQKEGLQWLWSLHSMQKGGILGDDMGLGKTLQCAAFLAGMLQSKLLK